MKSCGRTEFFTGDKANLEEEARNELLNPEKEITERTFESILDKVSGIIDKILFDMVLDEFHFLDHVEAIKSFIFLCRADFAEQILHGLEYVFVLRYAHIFSKELDKPATSIYKHNVTLAVDRVLRIPANSVLDKKGILENIKLCIDVPEPTKKVKREEEELPVVRGWEVFSLDYAVIPPLDSIFTPAVTGLHQQVSCLEYDL